MSFIIGLELETVGYILDLKANEIEAIEYFHQYNNAIHSNLSIGLELPFSSCLSYEIDPKHPLVFQSKLMSSNGFETLFICEIPKVRDPLMYFVNIRSNSRLNMPLETLSGLEENYNLSEIVFAN